MSRALPPPAAETLEASLIRCCGLAINLGRLEIVDRAMARQNLSKARSLLHASLQPADDRSIAGFLIAMAPLVARRGDSEDSADIAAAAYVSRLRDYPADVVAAALHDWPNRSQWWPTWFELKELLEPPTEARRRHLADIDFFEPLLEATPLPAAPEPTPAELAERAAAEASEHAEVSAGLRGLVVKLSEVRGAAMRAPDRKQSDPRKQQRKLEEQRQRLLRMAPEDFTPEAEAAANARIAACLGDGGEAA